jgi:hypothetical protein
MYDALDAGKLSEDIEDRGDSGVGDGFGDSDSGIGGTLLVLLNCGCSSEALCAVFADSLGFPPYVRERRAKARRRSIT